MRCSTRRLGLDWESSSDDADLVAAHCRVYNDWLIDFCSTDPSRLVPIAHVSFMDVEQAVAETRRVASLGAKGTNAACISAEERVAVR